MTSILTTLIITLEILTPVGRCIISCVRSLTQRLIETALTKQSPATYHNNLLFLEESEHESHLMLSLKKRIIDHYKKGVGIGRKIWSFLPKKKD